MSIAKRVPIVGVMGPGKLATEEEIKNADLIFSGVVTSYESKDELIYFTFQVTKTWKGDSMAERIIISDNSSCGAGFGLDQEYVVFSIKGRTDHCWSNERVHDCNFIGVLNSFRN